MNKPKPQILDHIRRVREAKHLSQEKLATAIGMDPSNYGRVERGDLELRYEVAKKIAQALGVSLLDLDEPTNLNLAGEPIEPYGKRKYNVVLELQLTRPELDALGLADKITNAHIINR